MISLGDSFLISKKNKIPYEAIIQMITNSAFFSPLVRNKIKKIRNNYKISFSYNNMLKDLKIFKNSNFYKTNTLSRIYKIYNKYRKMSDKKDSSFIIKKISQI
jgi:3-hydroxyisobutyrate dehydrogenase-like beta-hydroxyacid dehydrogenase